MRHIAFLAMIVVAPLMVAPAGAAEKVSDADRFQLWHDCEPMGLVVENLHKDAVDIGLTKDTITVAARSRLRSARLYQAGRGVPFLAISVNIVGAAHGILVTYSKWVHDRASGLSRGASLWDSASTGTHGGDPHYVLSSVNQHVDRFIDEYLRVNEAVCGKSG